MTKGTDNITTMKNPVTGCSVKVMPCANSKEAATRLGRGYTAPIMMYDELDFAPYIIDAIYASAFAYSTASSNAIANGSMACRLLLSTPSVLMCEQCTYCVFISIIIGGVKSLELRGNLVKLSVPSYISNGMVAMGNAKGMVII